MRLIRMQRYKSFRVYNEITLSVTEVVFYKNFVDYA